jgi:hypothetical protein
MGHTRAFYAENNVRNHPIERMSKTLLEVTWLQK